MKLMHLFTVTLLAVSSVNQVHATRPFFFKIMKRPSRHSGVVRGWPESVHPFPKRASATTKLSPLLDESSKQLLQMALDGIPAANMENREETNETSYRLPVLHEQTVDGANTIFGGLILRHPFDAPESPWKPESATYTTGDETSRANRSQGKPPQLERNVIKILLGGAKENRP